MRSSHALILRVCATLALSATTGLALAPGRFTFWVRPLNVKLAYGAQVSGSTAYTASDVLSYLSSVSCGPPGDTLLFSLGAGTLRDGLMHRRWTVAEAQPIPRGYICPVPLQLNDARGKFLEDIKIYVRTQ